jgi:succinylarginine dihydrolase
VPGFEHVEVAAAEVPLADAIRSYLFNAQLVTPPDGQPTLILPAEARETPTVWRWIERHVAGNGPIRRVEVVDVRQSMANGGGPACLRLRVVADRATVDPRFLVDEPKLDRIAEVIGRHWPEQIHHSELQQPALTADIERARAALLESLGLAELI